MLTSLHVDVEDLNGSYDNGDITLEEMPGWVHLSMAGEAQCNGDEEAGAEWRCSHCKTPLHEDKTDDGHWQPVIEPGELRCSDRECDNCDGSGMYVDPDDRTGENTAPCEECDGTGSLYHVGEPMPLSWCNSASISTDEADDSVTVSISVGDPRGGFVMRIYRCRYTRECQECFRPEGGPSPTCATCGGTRLVEVDELRLETPYAGMVFEHRPLTDISNGSHSVFRIG